MQQGSIIQAERKFGPNVWEFRWREPGPDGKRKHRRMVIGRIDQLVDESAARGRIAALHLDINFWDARLKGKPLTIAELAEHYRQRELKPDTVWKTYSTKLTYEGYLSKWILPRWGNYLLTRINAGEVELWLRSLPVARSSCAKTTCLAYCKQPTPEPNHSQGYLKSGGWDLSRQLSALLRLQHA